MCCDVVRGWAGIQAAVNLHHGKTIAPWRLLVYRRDGHNMVKSCAGKRGWEASYGDKWAIVVCGVELYWNWPIHYNVHLVNYVDAVCTQIRNIQHSRETRKQRVDGGHQAEDYAHMSPRGKNWYCALPHQTPHFWSCTLWFDDGSSFKFQRGPSSSAALVCMVLVNPKVASESNWHLDHSGSVWTGCEGVWHPACSGLHFSPFHPGFIYRCVCSQMWHELPFWQHSARLPGLQCESPKTGSVSALD